MSDNSKKKILYKPNAQPKAKHESAKIAEKTPAAPAAANQNPAAANNSPAAPSNAAPTEATQVIATPAEAAATGDEAEDAVVVLPKKTARSNNSDKKQRRKGCFSAAVWVLCIIIAAAGLAYGMLFMVADFLGIGKSGVVQLEIKKGTPTAEIARQLDDAGVIRYSTLFRIYTKLMGFDGTFQYGVYTIDKESGYESIARKLQDEGARAETVTVTIPEYANLDEIRKRFVEAGICSAEEFRDAVGNLDNYKEFDFIEEIPVERVYYKLEGYLFPDTYEFYKYESADCAKQAIRKCLAQMDSKLKPYRKDIEKSGYTVHEILTMASIIESEAGNSLDEDRAKVAAVFYNRLKGINWEGPKKLQSDPSTKYPHGDGRYDTYQTEGLPPGPMGAPSLRSIEAAVHPEKNFKCTYFVTDKNGKFYFNETLDAHNATIKDLKAKGLWLSTTLGN